MTRVPRARTASRPVSARTLPSGPVAARRRGGRPLTELEGSVLGLVWARGPCTPYLIRREFAASPSPHWSGSAGAIYPLMVRLERAGLLRPERTARGSRESRRYRLTPAGLRALTAWVAPPLSEAVLGVPPDPLRTRITFLGVLDGPARRAFLARAEEGLDEHLERARADLVRRRGGDPYEVLMAEGAVASLRARRAWIRGATRRFARRPRQG